MRQISFISVESTPKLNNIIMAKKKFKGDVEMYTPRKGVFPNPNIPMPKQMGVKLYRKKDKKVEYDLGGDIQVVIKKQHVKPKIMKYVSREEMARRMLKNPHKYTSII